MFEGKFVDGSNDFRERCLNKMIQLLDNGEKIRVGIDCIGHTRNNMVQEQYKKALEEHYGNKLNVKCDSGICSYSYTYWL